MKLEVLNDPEQIAYALTVICTGLYDIDDITGYYKAYSSHFYKHFSLGC